MAKILIAIVVLVIGMAVAEPPCNSANTCRALARNLAVMRPEFSQVADLLIEMVDSRATDENGEWIEMPNDVDSQWCPNKSFYEFLPVHVATVMPNSATVSWAASCFQNMNGGLVINASGGKLSLDAKNTSKADCNDWYLFSNAYHNYWFDVGTNNTQRSLSMKTWHDDELLDIQTNGLQVFIMPCGILGTFESAVKTIDLFIGKNLDKINIQFLQERKIYPTVQPYGKVVDIPASRIRSGDYIAVTRLDGLDPLVMFGTGGRTGHSAVAVWEGSTLYVCESTDKNPFGPVYWPPPYGIIRTEYSKWIELAKKAQYMVSFLPLAPAYSQKFDTNKYWAWFKTVQGMPYGYHNFLYSFLDTGAPMKNLPQPIDLAVFTWFITAMDRILPNTTEGVSVYSLFTEGLNQRLQTQCDNIKCVTKKLRDMKSDFGVITAQAEQDAWRYDGGKNYSMVCSVFAARSWIIGLGDALPSIQGTEQTPKDNYQMAIFDGNYYTNTNCPGGVMSDPTAKGSYCQVMGAYKMPLNNFNTITPYANMNSKCPSQWPGYERCPVSNPQCC